MRNIFYKIEQSQNPEELKFSPRSVIVYWIAAGFIADMIIKWLIVAVLSFQYEGGYSELRQQIYNMCGMAWWGGMDYSNYLLKPTPGDCNGIESTFWTGAPFMLGLGLIVIGLIRKNTTQFNLKYNLLHTVLIYLIVFAIVSVFRTVVGYDMNYHGHPDGTILYLNNFLLAWRMFKK